MKMPQRLVCVCAGVLTALAAAVPARAQVNAEQVLAIGRNVLGMEDYILAIQYFNQAVKAKPYLSDPYFFRAIAKLSLDDYKGAEQDCSLALERNPYKSEAYKVRGFARQQLGHDSLAVTDYDRGLEYNPLDKYFLFYKSVALTRMKSYSKADSTFAVLLRQYPKFDEGFAARGRLNVLRGDTAAALSDIERSLSLSKSQINPYLMRADINASRRQWTQALADMDEAVRMAPDEPDLYVNRAYLRYNDNDLFGAMSDYNYALDLQPGNTQALFNRALLRFEVRDLSKAADDFSEVLRRDPGNFHARYNRALIRLEQERYHDAQRDFQEIARKYPRFYPVYYGLAECRKNLNDLRGAFAYMNKADDMVRRYVDNPDRNPLDRPTIARDTNVESKYDDDSQLTDEQVMEKFNQLVTSGDVGETRLAYNERIKGRLQDRNIRVEPEPAYALSFNPPEVSLRSLSNYFRELNDLNQRRYISNTLYLVAGSPSPSEEQQISEAFSLSERLSIPIASGKARPVDWLARGVVYTMIKNYADAVADFDKAIELNPDFTVAFMGRAYARSQEAVAPSAADDEAAPSDMLRSRALQLAMADYDKALKLDPGLVYAWFNKGLIYYSQGDYTSAMQCFGEALTIDPEFGQAYFNRGLCYLNAGNRQQAFSDLSKAGELGVLPSYNLLKRMK